MTRRSLGFDAVGVADFETFEKWVQHLFQLMRQPAPPGLRSPNVTHLLKDRQALRMQRLTRDGVRPKAHGTRPMDKLLKNMLLTPKSLKGEGKAREADMGTMEERRDKLVAFSQTEVVENQEGR